MCTFLRQYAQSAPSYAKPPELSFTLVLRNDVPADYAWYIESVEQPLTFARSHSSLGCRILSFTAQRPCTTATVWVKLICTHNPLLPSARCSSCTFSMG